MVKQNVTVTETKCDGRTLAAALVRTAEKFKSQTVIRAGSRVINAKSIMGVLSLCITKGDSFTVVSDGVDEDSALDAVLTLIRSGFKI